MPYVWYYQTQQLTPEMSFTFNSIQNYRTIRMWPVAFTVNSDFTKVLLLSESLTVV